MDYEKAYKDAIERMKSWAKGEHSECFTEAQKAAEFIFPELKKSEDEKIRTFINNGLCFIPDVVWENNNVTKSEMLAWLEKQDDNNRLVEEIKKRKKLLSKEKEKAKSANDRISLGGRIAMLEKLLAFTKEKQGEQNSTDSYCKDNCKGYQETGKCYTDEECKAKRDTEQKSTQEIEPFEAEHGKYYYCIKDYFCGGRKQASKGDVVQALRGLPIMGLKDVSEYFLPVNNVQKPAWSKEDEKIIDDLTQTISQYTVFAHREPKEVIQWLKSLKPQPHWKPTVDQMQSLYFAVITYSKKDDYKLTYDSLNSLYEQLKKL